MLRHPDRSNVPLALSVGIVVGAVAVWSLLLPTQLGDRLGSDLAIYLEATQRWVDGGSFYLERQLGGPYLIETGDVLYPPTTIPLFVPFLVLPAVLWWVLPIAGTLWAIRRLRPAPWTWPVMLAFLALPHTGWLIISGNPVMWAVAALAHGAIGGWPAALVLLKPTLAPFALLGVRNAGWWVVCALGFGLALVFLPVWPAYFRVIENASGPRADVLYSLLDVPLMMIPVVAWIGRDGRSMEVIIDTIRARRPPTGRSVVRT